MKVSIGLRMRFHAYDLARELSKKESLATLYSGFPYFKAAEHGVPRSHYKSIIVPEAIARLLRRLPLNISSRINSNLLMDKLFDEWVARILPEDIDIFLGWSGCCLNSIRAANQKGVTSIIERGSSHIEVQRDLLTEEYDRWGFPLKIFSQETVDRELAGYEVAKFISVPSDFAYQSFLKKGVTEEKLLLAPYGVSTQDFYVIPNEGSTKFRIIFCGALSIQKGILYLLQAFSELDLPNSELWLLGSEEPQLGPSLAPFKMNEKIRFLGHQPQNKLVNYYNQCDLFVMPSIQEGLATVQLQAMACGLPVVHTPHTGGSNIIDEGVEGFEIPIRDIDAIKEKILWGYENRDACKAMGQNALTRVRERHTWADYAENVLANYREII